METDRIAELGNSFGKKTKESTGARHRHMSRAGDLLSTTNLSGSYNVRSKEKDGKDFGECECECVCVRCSCRLDVQSCYDKDYHYKDS